MRITPGAAVDFELRPTPVLGFSLRFSFADGSVVDDPAARSVTLLDVDDTAPTGLAFASGGLVVAGAIGAAIGRLVVTDPDTAAGFRFSFGEADDWRFEVVDGVLKLRDGISLGLDDMPQLPLIIEVWDGHHSAAFLLWIGVADPGTRLAELPSGETRGGFGLVDADTVFALRESRGVARVDALAGGEQLLTLQEGTQVVLPATQRVQFADGFQDIGDGSLGVQAAALVQALSGHAADGRALAGLVARAEAGMAWADIAATLPGLRPAMPMRSPRFTTTRWAATRAGRSWRCSSAGWRAGQRAQLAVDVALGAESLHHQPAGGVWVADALGSDGGWRAGTGGLPGSATPPPAATDPRLAAVAGYRSIPAGRYRTHSRVPPGATAPPHPGRHARSHARPAETPAPGRGRRAPAPAR